jgi:hypothetical protein
VLKYYRIDTTTLWKFLSNIAAGKSTLTAFNYTSATVSFTQRTLYRWRAKISGKQTFIRNLLCSICPVPLTQSALPLIQTISHLNKAFETHPCPCAAFQHHFQTCIV